MKSRIHLIGGERFFAAFQGLRQLTLIGISPRQKRQCLSILRISRSQFPQLLCRFDIAALLIKRESLLIGSSRCCCLRLLDPRSFNFRWPCYWLSQWRQSTRSWRSSLGYDG